MSIALPDFSDLPPVEGMPQGCAWGIFDKDGKKDVLGTLNLLTPEVVKSAAAEIQHGISVSLNWPLGSIKVKNYFRIGLQHKVLKLQEPHSDSPFGFDDELEFNTQGSSQWDSLCHFLDFSSGKAYNGFVPSVDELQNPSPSGSKLPTLDNWHGRGCVTTRGVLVDFKSYADAKGIEYSPFSGFRIGVSDLEAVAAYQGVTFRPGDILIVRFGFTEALENMNGDEQAAAMASHEACGLEGSEDMARWIWNKHFSGVASDNLAVEAMPPMVNGKVQPRAELVLHRWCLGLFGLPLGELWYLKTLSEYCKTKKKYSFFLTSAPLNVPGAVGSPPNALAIL